MHADDEIKPASVVGYELAHRDAKPENLSSAPRVGLKWGDATEAGAKERPREPALPSGDVGDAQPGTFSRRD
jgi:hypothetical protein